MTANDINNKIQTATITLLSQLASNRSEAISKIVTASKNARSLEHLQAEIESIAAFYNRADVVTEEAYRRAMS